jgi:transmembrane sensor
MNSLNSTSYKALEAASNWFVVLSDEPVSEADYSAWQDWLAKNDEHRKAWKQVETIGDMFSSFQSSESKQSARYVLEEQYSRDLNRRQLMKGMMGLTSIATLSWFSWEYTSLPVLAFSWNADFRTHVGQISSYDFNDGSKAWLNTSSAIDHNYDAQFRSVSLVTGEMFIQTQSTQENRPFIASCHHAVINAGKNAARFSVRHLSNLQTVLAVYEGRVSLTPLDGDSIQTVQAGQEVMFTSHTVKVTRPVEAMYESWVRGLLIVDGMPLSDFLTEVNRYRYGYINLDPSIADLQVVGTYPINNLDLVFSMLENSFPIRVRHSLSWWTSISAA